MIEKKRKRGSKQKDSSETRNPKSRRNSKDHVLEEQKAEINRCFESLLVNLDKLPKDLSRDELIRSLCNTLAGKSSRPIEFKLLSKLRSRNKPANRHPQGPGDAAKGYFWVCPLCPGKKHARTRSSDLRSHLRDRHHRCLEVDVDYVFDPNNEEALYEHFGPFSEDDVNAAGWIVPAFGKTSFDPSTPFSSSNPKDQVWDTNTNNASMYDVESNTSYTNHSIYDERANMPNYSYQTGGSADQFSWQQDNTIHEYSEELSQFGASLPLQDELFETQAFHGQPPSQDGTFESQTTLEDPKTIFEFTQYYRRNTGTDLFPSQ